MSNHSKNTINLSPGTVPRMILNGIPIVASSSVFHSPDKNSMTELKFRAIQAQQNLVKRNLNIVSQNDQQEQRLLVPPMNSHGAPTLAMPPPGLISESLVRDILALTKREYPWGETLLASKMTKEQLQLLMDKLPQLRNIITYRMPVVPQPQASASSATASVSQTQQQQQHQQQPPPLANNPPPLSPLSSMGTPHFMQEMASAAMAAAEKAQMEREYSQETDAKRKRRVTMNLTELLLQVKKCAELGLVDEDILDEPLSPMTMSMINSMVLHVKKLAETRRDNLAGSLCNPDDELAISKRLLEMREYIREEQRIYIEHLKKRPEEEHEPVEQILKRLAAM